MARRGKRDVAVGTLFALALVILALAVMAVGGESRLFVSKATYQIVFPSADGLRVGSPVKMNGVQIGSVSAIRLPTDPGDAGVQVQVGVDRAYAPRVGVDSAASARILLYLSGERYVEITPGSSSSAQLAPGSEIPLRPEKQIFEQGTDIAENLNEITVSLSSILASLERGEGLLGQMLKDPEFGKQGLEALRGSLENAERLSADLLARREAGYGGGGTVARLLYDEQLGRRLDRLGQAIVSLSELLAAVERREGALGALFDEGGAAELTIADMRDAAASLKAVTARLERGEGLVGRLLNDPEYSEAMAADLRSALADLAEITAKINRGEGSLGALVNERALYDGAEDVVAGVNDSKFARWLLRRYRKKGIKAQERAAGAEP